MKTDLYTKTILTIIAICLLFIADRDRREEIKLGSPGARKLPSPIR